MADDFQILGMDALQSALMSLSADRGRKIIRKAERAGAVIMRAAVQANTPVKAQNIGGTSLPQNAMRNDVIISAREDETGLPVTVVTFGRWTRFIAGYVEYGHRIAHGGVLYFSKRKKMGKHIGGRTRTSIYPASLRGHGGSGLYGSCSLAHDLGEGAILRGETQV